MVNLRNIWLVITLLAVLAGGVQAQTTAHDVLQFGDSFWTLPATECDGDNFCEVRISPEGTIYGWDNQHQKLYVSPINETHYNTYDLSEYWRDLVFVMDFIPFDDTDYVVFYSPPGASRSLSRYHLTTGELQSIDFPEGYNLIGCNRHTQVRQHTTRLIYQIGIEGRFMACTDSPQNQPIIHIINVNILEIEQYLDIDVHFRPSYTPGWDIAGGMDNRIYLKVNNPENIIPEIAQIEEQDEEIIFIYDVDEETWSYKLEMPHEMLAILPTEQMLYHSLFYSYFNNPFVFLGVTAEGIAFFSTYEDYSDITVINVYDSP